MVGNSEFWGGLFWLGVGAFVTYAGLDLGLGRLSEPGSGFALFYIGLILCALALVVIVEGLARGAASVPALWNDTRWARVLFVVVLLLVFGILFETLGFVVCALGLLLALMIIVDPVPLWQALPVAFGATFGVWYVLTKLLKIQLPMGLMAPWLG